MEEEIVNFGQYIYKDIEKNEYFKMLYQKLITSYIAKLCNIKEFEVEINKDALLRFADLLSKSNIDNMEMRAFHKNIAQTIVVLLKKLYREDAYIQYTMGSILSHVNNYVGLEKQCEHYSNSDAYEFINEYIDKSLHKFTFGDEYFNTPQMQAYQKLNELDYYSFSGPTSMGKTFIIKSYIKKLLIENEKKNFVIVVPTKALINEIKNTFIREFDEILYQKKYKVITTPLAIGSTEFNYIMIYTQERLLYHTLYSNKVGIDYLFIDEAHKISEISLRSGYFYKSVEILANTSDNMKIFFSAPNIPNPEVYLKLIPNKNLETVNYDRYKFSPVNQQKIIIDFKQQELYLYDDLSKSFISLNIAKSHYDDEIGFIHSIGNKANNIVYCNSKKEAVELAIKLYHRIEESGVSTEVEKLCKEIKNELHPKCFLIKLLKKGICYHVGYLPASIREQIERLYKEGDIHTVFCTSTLIEGVNLPADNLFILVKRHSYLLKNHANFKNLIGRVGRKTYNLVGNVFIITQTNSTDEEIQKCKTLIEEEIPKQILSIEDQEVFKPKIKKEIVELLESGQIKFMKKNAMSYDKYDLIRFTINTLLKDILEDNRSSVIYKQFEDLLNEQVTLKIKEAFILDKDKVYEDTNITLDQIKDIDKAIQREAFGYPDEINYSNILMFLEKLHELYKWETYESKNDIGKKSRLKYYAVLLNKWMNGNKVNQMINESINHAKSNGVYVEGNVETYDESNVWHINTIINDILSDLEEIVLFKISNYFLKFSQRAMKMQGIDKLLNDWHEYIEYGTQDNLIIYLQKIGFSREVARMIINMKLYNVKDNKEVYFTDKILECTDTSIQSEAKEVFINYRELFVEVK